MPIKNRLLQWRQPIFSAEISPPPKSPFAWSILTWRTPSLLTRVTGGRAVGLATENIPAFVMFAADQCQQLSNSAGLSSQKSAMKSFAFFLAAILLIFNGGSALVGGWLLIADPSGQNLMVSPDVLRYTPFNSFLVPGIVLFSRLGVFSFTALAALLWKFRPAALFVLAEGVLLTGWIVVQILWTQVYHPLQAVMGATGLLLIASGWILSRAGAAFNENPLRLIKSKSFLV